MDIMYNSIKGGIEITSFCSDDEEVIIPEEVDGKKVLSIDFFALNCDNAEKITLPSTLTKICSTNFENCPNLISVDMSKTNIETLEEEIFSNCFNLETVLFPENLKNIEKSFKNCPNLKKVTIPSNVETLLEPFIDCNVVDFTIGKNVSVFKPGANFVVDKITVDKDNKTLISKDNLLFIDNKEKLVYAPKKIGKIKLPKETKIIEDKVFSGAQIEELDINQVTNIGVSTFENAEVGILIANSLSKVSNKSFKGLHTNHIEIKNLKYIDEASFEGAAIGDIVLSDDITTICYGAFMNADIKKFVCPKSLTLIDSYAFADSTLEEIVFNDKLTEIGENAFKSCLKKTEIFLPKSLKILNTNAFTYSPDSIYHLNKDIEYINGICFPYAIKECKNILTNLTEEEKEAFYADTNLADKELGTLQSLEELLKDDTISFKEANKLAKLLKSR